jgi:hypothetical protein
MKSARKIAFYMCISLAVIIVVVGAFFIHGLIEPVTTTNITVAAAPATPTIPPVEVKGTYASFSYPGTLKPLTGLSGPTGDELAVYNFGKPDIESWHLAISINQLSQPTLTDDSGYVLRENDPSLYQPSYATYGKNAFSIMTYTKAGDFNETAFMLDGDKSADISLIGNDPSGISVLANAFRQVLQSWNWQ